MKLRLLTINVHKGFSPLNKRFMLPQLRKYIHSTSADIIFLQEVVGQNIRKAAKYFDWPAQPQDEYIAGAGGFDHVYGKNVIYTAGHHGNAILSRFPIVCSEKIDISTNRFEKRGILYGRLRTPGLNTALHCVCVHFGLFYRSRKKQFAKLSEYLRRVVPEDEPLIVAGDFNEWRENKKDELETRLWMKDCGLEVFGKKLRTFPSIMPLFPLDRIYLRGFRALGAGILNKGVWKNLSDHAAFSAEVEWPAEAS